MQSSTTALSVWKRAQQFWMPQQASGRPQDSRIDACEGVHELPGEPQQRKLMRRHRLFPASGAKRRRHRLVACRANPSRGIGHGSIPASGAGTPTMAPTRPPVRAGSSSHTSPVRMSRSCRDRLLAGVRRTAIGGCSAVFGGMGGACPSRRPELAPLSDAAGVERAAIMPARPGPCSGRCTSRPSG